MKGWYNNSYKHLLASRGIETTNKKYVSPNSKYYKSAKMFEKLDETSKIKTQTPAEINYILYKTKLKYGTTDDIEKAYFLLPDGTFISDREFCGGMHDNIDVEGVSGEFRFNYITGSISVVPTNVNKVYIRIYGKPSAKQLSIINDYSKSVDILVDLIDCVEDDDKLICQSEALFDLNNNFDLGKINRYFNSDIKGQGYEKVMTKLMGRGSDRQWP